jgi:hypothetical protein
MGLDVFAVSQKQPYCRQVAGRHSAQMVEGNDRNPMIVMTDRSAAAMVARVKFDISMLKYKGLVWFQVLNKHNGCVKSL